jgi:hypothetical protein
MQLIRSLNLPNLKSIGLAKEENFIRCSGRRGQAVENLVRLFGRATSPVPVTRS